MLQVLLLILTLICATKCEHYSSYSTENLYAILDQTTEYFKTLNNAYKVLNIDTSNNINNAINKYMENTTKVILQSKRQKRSVQDDLEFNKDVNVLRGFEETLSFHLPDFRDIAFFSIQDEHQQLWHAAAINSSNILFYQFIDNKPQLVGTYPQSDGKRIIVNNHSADTLIVVQTDDDAIVILRLSKNKSGVYELQFKQEFEIPGVMHMSMWLGMNKLYLGIASETKILVYDWLGEHFDKIDTLRFGARKLLPFQNKNFVYLVIVGSRTRIFRFSVRSNKFVEMQKLRYAEDASSFYFKEGHFEERFLALADNDSTILYKEMYGRFVPFQRLAPTKSIHSLIMKNTAVLLFVEEDTAEIYQYNGWRFLKLHTRLSNARQIHRFRSYGEDTLEMQSPDGKWKFLTPTWTVKKTWKSLQNEIAAWCSEIQQKASQRTLEKISDDKIPRNFVISNAHIGQLRVQNINNHSAEESIRLTQQYNNTIAKLNLANGILAQITEKSSHATLYGKKITVKCMTDCRIHHIITNNEITTYGKSELDFNNQIVKFSSLKVATINNWKCPIPNVKIDDILVKESVNGILMKDLQERTLKISGDQEISGVHVFANLHATNVSIPLDIATSSTKQTVQMKEVRVKELYLTEDEFFLPLNGSTTAMNGSITATRVRVTGPVEMKGKITGKAREKLAPLREIAEPLTLSSDRFLQNVTFSNLVKAKDIVRTRGPSLKDILENSIPLNSNITTHLILSSDKTQWNNVILPGYTDWVTKNSAETVVISGAKFANNTVILPNAAYENLPIPKLTIPLCAMVVISPEIRTSVMTMGDLVVKNLNVSNVIGAYDLNTTIFDSVSALHSVDFSAKIFTGQVSVKNISALRIKGIDLRDLETIQMNKQTDVNYLKGPVNIANLVVDNLETPVYLNLSLPIKIKNVILKTDSDIRKINDVYVQSFMENVLKTNDAISLEHVTLARGFTSDHIHASRSTLNFSDLGTQPNLHSKRILTTLKADAINVPQTFGYLADDSIPSTFIVQGSVRFLTEPLVQNVNGANLKQLSEDLWMADQDAVISGSNVNVENMTLNTDVIIYDPMNMLHVTTWLDLSNKLLSKTRDQRITVASSFKKVEVPAVTAAKNSTIRSMDFNLRDMLANSLMRNTTQTVYVAWHFEELDISNVWNGKFNGIDLRTDVVRRDAKRNIITGRKTISSLAAKDLWPLNVNFSNFASNALTKKCQKLSIIKGQKTFNNITLNNLSVKGTITGRNIEEALLKYGNQTLFGMKKIQGQLNVPSLNIDGTVNDVNLTELMNDHIKKRKAVQTIESNFDFRNDLEIFGNITISGLYEGTNLTNISDQNKIGVMLNRMTKVMTLAEDVSIALQNRAIYVSKLETIDENTLQITSNVSNVDNMIDLNNTCLCELTNNSSLCNDTKLLNILAGTNSSVFEMKKLVLLDDAAFIVIVSSDFVSIYSYVVATEELHHVTGLYVPGILEGYVEPIDNSLWIILRLSEQTLILRYQAWNELEQYILPGSDSFVISKTPNNQRLLIRSDGIWNLEGVLRPEHIFKMSLDGQINTFALGNDYYIKATTENSTTVLKARYVGN